MKKKMKKQKEDECCANTDAPGDTRCVLSWIWFTGSDGSGASDGLHGCEYILSSLLFILESHLTLN